MKGGKRPLGYTIIEVMIVLAVSGVMFLIAANFINGKQARTSFTQGVNEAASRIQATIQDVSDGHYSDIGFSCVASGGSPDNLTFTNVGGGSIQGQNSPCVFVGKFMHYSVGNPGDPTKYEVFSIAAPRNDLDLSNAEPIAPFAGSNTELTVQYTIPQNLIVKSVNVTSGGSTFSSYGFGFTQGQGTAANTVTPGATGYVTGSQAVNLVYSPNLNGNSNLTETAAALAITHHISAADSATICLTDGTRTAKLNIGGNSTNNNQLIVIVEVTSC